MSEKSTLMLEKSTFKSAVKSTLMLEKCINVVFVEHTWCMLNIRYVCLVNYGSFLVPLCGFFLFVLPTLKLVKSTLKLVKSTLKLEKSTLMSIKSTLKLVKSTLKLV